MSDSQIHSAHAKPIKRADILFFSAAFIFLYTQLFQFPFTPYYFDGDHIIIISNAIRMLGGEVMYRDFFHLAPPGAELVYLTLFSIFGVKVWVLNVTILFLGLALVGLTWFFSRQVLTGLIVYLPASIFLIVGYRLFFIDGTYRLFSVVCVLSTISVLMSKRTHRNVMIAGGICGLASFFMQPRGIAGVTGISLFLLWENYHEGFNLKRLIEKGLYLSLPFFLVVALTQSYFVYHAGFDNYYFSLVTFLREHYPKDPLSNGSAYLSDLPNFKQYLDIYSPVFAAWRYFRIAFPLLFYLSLIPLVYFVFLLVRWRKKTYLSSRESDAQLMLLCLAGLALSAGVSAFTPIRLSHVAIPGIILLVWLIKQTAYSERIAAACLALLAVIGFSYVVQRQNVAKYYLDMPAGRSAFFSEQYYGRYKWIGEHTKPGEPFYEGHHPSYYFPFYLKNPTPMYLIRDSDYTPAFQVEAVVKGLQNDPPNLIAWPRKWTKSANARVPGDHLEILWHYIVTNYEFEVEFPKPLDYTPYSEGDIDIWRLKELAPRTPLY